MKKDNPFTLTFGRQPNKYINRFENTSDIVDTFDSENPVCQTYLIEGVRGSGKTVLMTRAAKELEETGSWIVIDLNPTQDLLVDFANRLVAAVKMFPNIFDKGFSVSFAGFGLGLNGEEKNNDPVGVIENILTHLKKKKKRILITIDEVKKDDNMRVFASQFQIFIRRDYPLFLIMTGLIENINEIQNDPSLTFLLRSPKINLAPLGMIQIVNQYKDIFELDQDSAKDLAKITKGYAFAFQALGTVYWEYRDEKSMEQILGELDSILDDYVYKKIWENLSKQDKKVLLAMNDNEATKTKDISKKSGIKTESLSKYRERLIKKGLIQSPEHGYLEMTLPRFHSVIKNYV